MKPTDKILAALSCDAELCGSELASITRCWAGSLYPALMKLEKEGVIESRWEDRSVRGPWAPRRRLYKLVKENA